VLDGGGWYMHMSLWQVCIEFCGQNGHSGQPSPLLAINHHWTRSTCEMPGGVKVWLEMLPLLGQTLVDVFLCAIPDTGLVPKNQVAARYDKRRMSAMLPVASVSP
jgi:hypothetical protein